MNQTVGLSEDPNILSCFLVAELAKVSWLILCNVLTDEIAVYV